MLGFQNKSLAATVALCGLLLANAASAQTADTVMFNGKILTVDKEFSTQQALAIENGRVLASGTSAAMKKLASDKARLIDLGGRTVIPGLTDGHIHGIRAALTFGTEVNWIGIPTLKEALEKVRQARQGPKARLLDRSRRWLDRRAVPGKAPAECGRSDRGRTGQSGLHPASL
jgi:hypothetical protein